MYETDDDLGCGSKSSWIAAAQWRRARPLREWTIRSCPMDGNRVVEVEPSIGGEVAPDWRGRRHRRSLREHRIGPADHFGTLSKVGPTGQGKDCCHA